MSSELHKYIEKAIDKKENLLKAKILKFPNEKNQNYNTDLKKKKLITGKLVTSLILIN